MMLSLLRQKTKMKIDDNKSLKEDKNKKELVLLIEDYHDNRESSENIAWFYDCDFEFLNSENIEKISRWNTC